MENINKFNVLAKHNDKFKSLRNAFKKGYLNRDVYMENVYADIDEDYERAFLCEISDYGKPALIDELLKFATHPLNEEILQQALRSAVVHGNHKATEYFLKRGVQVTDRILWATVMNAHNLVFDVIASYVDLSTHRLWLHEVIEKELQDNLESEWYERYHNTKLNIIKRKLG